MFLAQVRKIPGIHLVAVIDLVPQIAKSNLKLVGWSVCSYSAENLDQACKNRTAYVGDDWFKMVSFSGIDVVIEATGDPLNAIEHCLESFKQGKHVITATVEADAFCGLILSNGTDFS